jgi:hypothetical protein
LTFCRDSTQYSRIVGESASDIAIANNSNTPGILYDYVGQNIQSAMRIRGGHNIDAASMLYVYGPNRKNTPN